MLLFSRNQSCLTSIRLIDNWQCISVTLIIRSSFLVFYLWFICVYGLRISADRFFEIFSKNIACVWPLPKRGLYSCVKKLLQTHVELTSRYFEPSMFFVDYCLHPASLKESAVCFSRCLAQPFHYNVALSLLVLCTSTNFKAVNRKCS